MPSLTAFAPPVFVVLWSSAFVGAKFGLPHAEPLTFLFLRFVFVTLAFAAIALALGSRWPRDPRRIAHIAVVGALVHGVYLSGVFVAISRGFPVGLAALIVGLQPILTTLFANRLLGETVRPRQWLGLILGVSGVLLVLWERTTGAGVDPAGVGLCLLSLACISYGTVHHKRHCADMNLVTGSLIQALTAGAAIGLAALALESMQVAWTLEFSLSLAWLVIVVSLGAFTLLMVMIRHGAAVKVVSLFYMVPPCAAVLAWIAFGEALGLVAGFGVAVTACGVALVLRLPGPAR